MTPVLRRTWAPCGITPTFSVRARSHEKVSGIGALIVSPRRHQITLALALYPRLNIRGPQVLRFLGHLARHVRGPIILVWDRGNPHKHQLVRAWLATQRKKQRHAMVHNAARSVQRIFEDAAAGDQTAYGPAIKALGLMHDVLQPGKDEGNGGGPRMHAFARAPQVSPPLPAESSPADEPGSVVRDGKLYVDGDL